MQFKELVVGEAYILSHPHGIGNATFEGKHQGKMELADGAMFYGAEGALRFSFATEDDGRRIVFVPNGSDVVETVGARTAREKMQEERTQLQHAATDAAQAFIESLGFKVVKGYSYQVTNDTIQVTNATTDPDAVELGGMTIGKLRKLVASAITAEMVGRS